MLKLIYIYDDVGSNVDYLSVMGDGKGCWLDVDDEDDPDNHISVGTYARNEVDVNVDDSVGSDVHKSVGSEVGRGNDVRQWCWWWNWRWRWWSVWIIGFDWIVFWCGRSTNKGSKGVNVGGHVGVGGIVGVCVGRCVDKSACFVIGGSYVILYLILIVDLILVIFINLLWFE